MTATELDTSLGLHVATSPANGATIMLLLKRIDCVDGVAAYLETLVTGLRHVGDSVVIVSGAVTTPDGTEPRLRAIRQAVRDWIVLPGLNAAGPNFASLRQVLSIIRRHDVDVVSPQGFSMLPLGTLAGRLSRRPIVANYHPSMHGDQASAMSGQRSIRERIAYRALAAICRADRYIAVSRHIALFFHDECRISEDKIHEQVLGIDDDFYRPPTDAERCGARQAFGIDAGALVCVLPGRMSLNKGHDVAAEAVRLLRDTRPDLATICLFPGGGGQRAEIEANVVRNAADREQFRFLGFVDRETLRRCYWAADIVLLPSRIEGFGLVVAEAMCCGAIVIRTPSGGWQDQVVEGRTGFLVPFNDPAAVAAAIEKVAGSPDRASMREETMRFAAVKFSKARMVGGTSALYREIARKGQGALPPGPPLRTSP